MKANQSYVTKAGRERQGNTASKEETAEKYWGRKEENWKRKRNYADQGQSQSTRFGSLLYLKTSVSKVLYLQILKVAVNLT